MGIFTNINISNKLLALVSISVFIGCESKTVCNSTYFGGKIINPKTNHVVLFENETPIDTFYLDNKNSFLGEITSLNEGLFYFKHGNENQYVYLEPKDSLLIRLNTWNFDETLVFSGKGAEKNNLLIEAQDNLASFKDRNLNISRNSFSNAQTRLETALQIETSVFQNVVTQLEQVKLQVTKDTPVFSFLKPVVVPTEKSAPKRSLIVIIWLFLGVVIGIGYLLAKESVLDMIKQIKNNPS